jgi:riboflavin biosynthesis pyrimidine reductase
MSSNPSASAPAVLTSLIGDTARRHLSAAQVVERLRLWDPGSPAPSPGDRPRVFLNMASSADGRATLEGRSGPIGNRADKELFLALRTAVDAVLFGAGTARAEHYRRLVKDESQRRLRLERGLTAEPLACIVSASLTLSPEGVPLLGEPDARVVILTPSAAGVLPAGDSSDTDTADAGALPAGKSSGATAPNAQATPGGHATTPQQGSPAELAASVEYVRTARDGQLDLPAALAELHTRWGVQTVMCEGGPHLNGDLLAAGVVDELFLTLAPKLGGGAGPQGSLRIVCGPELSPPVELELLEVLESDGCLLLRYGVGGDRGVRPPAR